MRYLALIAICLAASLMAAPTVAQSLIGQYTAFIGQADLFNSSGARLTQPWQVLRQDRANVHRFGISQPGDEFDPFFGSIDNRAAMERMVMNGFISPAANQAIMGGGSMVTVSIYGSGDVGTQIEVDVWN